MIDPTKKSDTPAQLAFVGTITFCGSYVRQDRATNVMTFDVMVDWMKSCADHFEQMVVAGDYDGSEIFIDVYEYQGGLVSDSIYTNLRVDQFVIDNDQF